MKAIELMRLCALTLVALLLATVPVNAQLFHRSHHDFTEMTTTTINVDCNPVAVGAQEKAIHKRLLRITLDLGEVYPLGSQDWQADLQLHVRALAQVQHNGQLKAPYANYKFKDLRNSQTK